VFGSEADVTAPTGQLEETRRVVGGFHRPDAFAGWRSSISSPAANATIVEEECDIVGGVLFEPRGEAIECQASEPDRSVAFVDLLEGCHSFDFAVLETWVSEVAAVAYVGSGTSAPSALR
jgi:hypothetical protein